jgi:hypothetical protein
VAQPVNTIAQTASATRQTRVEKWRDISTGIPCAPCEAVPRAWTKVLAKKVKGGAENRSRARATHPERAIDQPVKAYRPERLVLPKRNVVC